MARGVNKCIIVGNLGADPETRSFPDGGAVTNINVATTDAWRDKNTGQMQERTEWHRVVLRDRGNFKLAQIAAQYLRKGSSVYIEGSIRTRKWQDQQGGDRYTTEIMANEMQMLDSRNDNQGGAPQQNFQQQDYRGHPNSNQPNPTYGQQPSQQQNAMPQQPPGFDDFEDDPIPF